MAYTGGIRGYPLLIELNKYKYIYLFNSCARRRLTNDAARAGQPIIMMALLV